VTAGNVRLPDPTAPNNLLAPFWTDMNLGDGGQWYAAGVSDDVNDYNVFSWESVPRFNDPTTYTFQIWNTVGTEDYWFVYAEVPAIPADNLTVGFENSTGTLGTSYYYNGEGTAPAVGTDLKVSISVGGRAILGFQAVVNAEIGDSVINTAESTNSSVTEQALAVTTVIAPAPDIVAQRFVRFYGIRAGQSTVMPVGVRNVGTVDLVIGQIGAANPLAPPFSIASDGCSNGTLAPSQSCHFEVSFDPSGLGVSLDTVEIPSNDPDSPNLIVAVHGVAFPEIRMVTHGIAAEAGECRNLMTGQTVTAPLGGGATLSCERLGLTASTNDALVLIMRGVAQSEADLGGRAPGVHVNTVRCHNETTGESVFIQPEEPWDCVAEGLVVSPGDTVSMVASGDSR